MIEYYDYDFYIHNVHIVWGFSTFCVVKYYYCYYRYLLIKTACIIHTFTTYHDSVTYIVMSADRIFSEV